LTKKREELEIEEVDKLILNSLYCEIMDEVMDLGNAYPLDCNTTPRENPSSSSTKRKKTRSKSKNKKVKMRSIF
jgi:hypothetical protein